MVPHVWYCGNASYKKARYKGVLFESNNFVFTVTSATLACLFSYTGCLQAGRVQLRPPHTLYLLGADLAHRDIQSPHTHPTAPFSC